MRDNRWLAQRLKGIWERYFPEIKQKNEVIVRFGRRSKTRLGSICLSGQGSTLLTLGLKKILNIKPKTIITINGFFKSKKIPEYVVDGVIAHELTHYAHGFGSTHKRKFKYPHKHGVVRKEMDARGLSELLGREKKWVKANWLKIISK